MTYQLTVVKNGRGKAYQCRVAGSRAVGWSTRADLAIRDWKRQSKAFDKVRT
jgi:hypothetical protein